MLAILTALIRHESFTDVHHMGVFAVPPHAIRAPIH
jgi:hypothetical protein